MSATILGPMIRVHRSWVCAFCSMSERDRSGGGQQTGIQSSYLYVSRRPLNLAAGYAACEPGRLSPDLLEFLITVCGEVPLRMMLQRAGLPLDGPVPAAATAALGNLDTMVSW